MRIVFRYQNDLAYVEYMFGQTLHLVQLTNQMYLSSDFPAPISLI